MRSVPALVFALLGVLVACRAYPAAADGGTAPLRLAGSVGRQEVAVPLAEKGELRVVSADGALAAVPREVRWRLEGDLRANADALSFAAEYRIVRRAAAPMIAGRHTRAHAIAFVRPGWPWSKAELTDGVLVFVWLVDGRPVHVKPVAAETRAGPSSAFAAIVAWELDDTTIRGAPVVALWRTGAWVPPATLFDHAAVNDALAAMFLAPPEEFARAMTSGALARQTGHGATLLHVAAEGGFDHALKVLLERGGRPNARNAGDNAPLHLAAAQGRATCAQVLLQARADRLAVNRQDTVSLDIALARGHLSTALVLLGEQPSRERLQATLDLAVRQHDDEAIAALNAALTRRLGEKFKPAAAPELPADAVTLRILAESDVARPPALRTAAQPEIMLQLRQNVQSVMTTEVVGVPNPRGPSIIREVSTIDVLGPYDSEAATNHWAVVTLLVGADGKPYVPRIVDAVSRPFAESVLKVLPAYEFLPGEHDGQAVATQMTLVVTIPP